MPVFSLIGTASALQNTGISTSGGSNVCSVPMAFASNVTIAGAVSAGAISAATVTVAGSFVASNINVTGALTQNGVAVSTGGGNIAASSTSNSFVPASNAAYDLGSVDNRWRNLYLAGNAISFGSGATITAQNWAYLQNFVLPTPAQSTLSTSINYVFDGAAQNHSALIQDGKLYTFGANGSGQLGQGDTLGTYGTPTLVAGISNAAAVVCGQAFTVVRTADCNVLVMGANAYGQLGVSPAVAGALSNPTVVSSLSNVAAIACGWDYALFLLNSGGVVGLGNNGRGQLGNGATAAVNCNLVAMTLPAASNGSGAGTIAGYAPSTVTCGAAHTCLVLKNGMAYLCGDNTSNQLGVSAGSVGYATVPGLLTSVQGIVKAACGTYHTLVAQSFGDVWAFGANGTNQLGAGTASNFTAPQKVFSYSNVTTSNVAYSSNVGGSYAMDGGQGHSVLATCYAYGGSNDPTYVWGDNSYGQLGLGQAYASASTPTLLAGYQGLQVGCGQYHTVMLKADTNTFVGFGGNSNGQMGDANLLAGAAAVRWFPNSISPGGSRYAKVLGTGCQALHSAVVDTDGTLYLAGYNPSGQIGCEFAGVNCSNAMPVASFDQRILGVACGYAHTAAVDGYGKVWTWGNNNYGNLGNNNTGTNSSIPVAASTYGSLAGVTTVAAVACGQYHTLAVDSTGKVHAWGLNSSGQLGNTTTTDSYVPIVVTLGSITARSVIAVACGDAYSVALDSVGKVHAWGANGVGQLGNSTIVSYFIPLLVSYGSIATLSIAEVACGQQHTVALDTTGKVHAWGLNNYGQLGNSTLTNSSLPLAVSSFGTLAGIAIVSIACGFGHTVALDSTGKVHSWGYNNWGQLGNSTITNVSIPTAVSSFGSLSSATVVAIACGQVHTLALDSMGHIHAWGHNGYGELGVNSTSSSTFPILAMTSFGTVRSPLTGAPRYLSRGYGFHKVVRPQAQLGNASIVPAGDNSYGQLGDGTQTYRYTGVTSALTFPAAVVASANSLYHSAVVLSNGATYVWGRNTLFECGLASGAMQATATLVCAALSAYNAKDVACGTGVTLVLTTTGTVVAMGTNLTGMLGNGSAVGTTTSASGPVVVSALTNVTAIAAGENHAVAIDASGYLWAWGANPYGQFGTGTTAAAVLAPVMVPMASTGGVAVLAASAGFGHTLIVTANGKCMAAGLNFHGQLGNAANVATATPNAAFTTVTFPASSGAAGTPCETYAADVACGMHHSVVTMANGTIRCFGLNDRAQLGQPGGTGTTLKAYPPDVLTANSTTISTTAYGTGTYVASASANNGGAAMWASAWGAFATRIPLASSTNGWYSPGGTYSGTSPYGYAGSVTTVAGGTSYAGEWLQLQLPAAIVLARFTTMNNFNTTLSPGVFYVLGSNDGTTWTYLGTFGGRLDLKGIAGTYYPVPTTAAYSYFRMVINSLLGAGSQVCVTQWLLYAGSACSSTPVRPAQSGTGVGGVRNVCSAAASVDTTYVEAVLGREMVAYNAAGTATVPVFTKVRSYGLFEMESGDDVIATGCESSSTVMVTKAGAVHAWGANGTGQLGNNTVTSSPIPLAISGFGSLSSAPSIVAASIGAAHTVVLDSTGKVHAWGYNLDGELGRGTTANSSLPLSVSSFGSLAATTVAVTAVACGGYHTVALDSTGKVHTWGANGNGQIGNNSLTGAYVPTAIAYGSIANLSIAAVACGQTHTAALDSTGKVHTWGLNNYGQLGNSTLTSSSIPLQVSYGSIATITITAVACGETYMVALDSTGRVHAWGRNSDGELGNNTNTNSTLPIAVSSFGSLASVSIAAIACGAIHTVALDTTGKVHAWGWNYYGQLGNTTMAGSLIPISVSSFGSLTSVTIVAVACGYYNTVALDSTGKVHTWGYNNNGQLGNNTITQSYIPVVITGLYGSLATASIGSIFWNFTGQHRCFVEGYSAKDLPRIEGLVVCADRNRYVTTDAATGDHAFLTGADAITTNDALPVLSLASKAHDKTAFGVVSLATNYNPAPDPTAAQLQRALEEGDQRAEINALGEGAMWVCDACAGTASIESGDYITTSPVPGYGMRQVDDCIRNYTVAKATMDCDFAPPQVPVLRLRKDALGNNVTDPLTGMPLYDPVLTDPVAASVAPDGSAVPGDPGGLPVTKAAYRTRFLAADGTQITPEEYAAAVAANATAPEGAAVPVYRAAFVGCTYHCG
jgi:alpha-tubulin suppressor-like RCC1 family protein